MYVISDIYVCMYVCTMHAIFMYVISDIYVGYLVLYDIYVVISDIYVCDI